jgi:branched-chain amino acid transport system ATP-binding protein
MLELSAVHKYFGGLHAVNNVSFKVAPGTIKAVIGPNGAGKTTLFNLIAGGLEPSSGTITFKGRPIQGLKPHRVASLGMARTFQNIKLFHGMTALENVMLGRHIRSRSGFLAGMFNLPRTWKEEKDIRARSMALLELLDIAGYADVELLDEPAAGLNIYETAEIARLIERTRDMGITVLLVEHDMSLVMDISDEIVVLSFGEKIAEDVPDEIQRNPDVIKIYLGEDEEAAA